MSATPPLYTYIQSNEDAVVVFRLESNTSKKDVAVVIKPSTLEVRHLNLYTAKSVLSSYF